MSHIPNPMHRSGEKRQGSVKFAGAATVSAGAATWNMTDDGTTSGAAFFPAAVYQETAAFWVNDASKQYQFGSWTLGAQNKTLTMNINVLNNILLGIPQYQVAANGTTVNLTVRGH